MKLPHSKLPSIAVVLGKAGLPPERGLLRAPQCRRTRDAKAALLAANSFVVRSAELSHALAAAPIWTPRNLPRGQRRLNGLLELRFPTQFPFNLIVGSLGARAAVTRSRPDDRAYRCHHPIMTAGGATPQPLKVSTSFEWLIRSGCACQPASQEARWPFDRRRSRESRE